MLTISLIAQKGGTGKTTLARSLAIAFERNGQATAIIDMDPQASAALWGKRRESDQPEVISTVLPLLADVLKAASETVKVVLIDTPPKNADVAIAAARAVAARRPSGVASMNPLSLASIVARPHRSAISLVTGNG
jgi:chromosome partitioning protein